MARDYPGGFPRIRADTTKSLVVERSIDALLFLIEQGIAETSMRNRTLFVRQLAPTGVGLNVGEQASRSRQRLIGEASAFSIGILASRRKGIDQPFS